MLVEIGIIPPPHPPGLAYENIGALLCKTVYYSPTHLKCPVLGHGKLQGGEEVSQQQPEQPLVILDELGEVHVPARTVELVVSREWERYGGLGSVAP